MRPGDKDIEQEEREAERRHQTVNQALCVEVITEWNRLMERRHKPGWSPTIGVTLAAKFFWLDVICPGCRQLKQVDLRKIDRHSQMSLYGLIPALSCRGCQPAPPFAQIVKLSQHAWESPHKPAYMPKRGI